MAHYEKQPIVSVVIATYNYAAYLEQAIDSVKAQTFKDWECIVVDDASTDETQELVAKLVGSDGRIIGVKNDCNLGEAGSRNRGNALARGKYIAVLDADDWWKPNKLQDQVDALNRSPGAVLCYTAAECHPRQAHDIVSTPDYVNDLAISLVCGNEITHSSVLIERSAFVRVGGYDESLSLPVVDWDLWLRIMRRFGPESIVYIDELLTCYRVHQTSMSANWRKLTRGERIIIGRFLREDHWAFKNWYRLPAVADGILEREYRRYVKSGEVHKVWACAAVRVLLGPARRWRWVKAHQMLRQTWAPQL